MIFNKCNYILAPLLFWIIVSLSGTANAFEYAVVINSQNDFDGNERELKQYVQRVFLKQQTTWPGNITAYPLDREKTDSVRIAFQKIVLNMTEQELRDHWLSLKQRQGQTPPRTVGSSKILLKLISRKAGGIGVINLLDFEYAPENVKILFRFMD